jgi:hypothetical protein
MKEASKKFELQDFELEKLKLLNKNLKIQIQIMYDKNDTKKIDNKINFYENNIISKKKENNKQFIVNNNNLITKNGNIKNDNKTIKKTSDDFKDSKGYFYFKIF